MIGSAHGWPGWGLPERIWCAYSSAVVAMVGWAWVTGSGVGGARWGWFVAVQTVVLLAVVGLARVPLAPWARSVARSGFALLAVTTSYYSMALVLPGVHPEPFEWTWIAWDRWVFGADPTVALQSVLWPPFVEVLQVCYATFYLVPIAVVVGAWWYQGWPGMDAVRDSIVLGFLLSYLGYMLWPTLPPYHFLWHERAIEGWWLAESLHRSIDAAEVQRWNCFPSGHTMLSTLSLALAWRHARPLCYVLLPGVALLVFSTVALRYHYAVDVLAGLIGVVVTLWLGDKLVAAGAGCDPPVDQTGVTPTGVTNGTSGAAR